MRVVLVGILFQFLLPTPMSVSGNSDPSAPISLLLHPFLLSRPEKETVTNLGTVADLGTTLIPLNFCAQTFYSIKCCH